MKKLKLLLCACALLMGVNGAWGQYTKANLVADGWAEITSTSEINDDSYFLFVSHNTEVMMKLAPGVHQEGLYNAPWYKTSVDPTTDMYFVWTLTSNNQTETPSYSIACAAAPLRYLQTEYNASHCIRTHDNGGGDKSWHEMLLSYDGTNKYWTIKQCKYDTYLGPWDNVAAANNLEFAGNRGTSDAGLGKFKIYKMTKTAFATLQSTKASMTYLVDKTNLITNPDFAYGPNDQGWTVPTRKIGNYNFNGAVEQWHYEPNFDISQTLSVENGHYKITVQTSGTETARLYAQSGDNTSETASTNTLTGNFDGIRDAMRDMTSGTISTEIYVANGTLKIGLKDESSISSWLVFDNFRLYYRPASISDVAETFTSGSTMTAGQWYAFTVPADGDYTFSATDGIVYSVTDELASTAGTAVAATTALPAGTVYLKSTTSQALTISYVTPVVANGTYYLYDETNKGFLARGNAYGTEASIDKYGVPFTWNNYSKTFEFLDWTGVYMFITGTSVYTDNTGSAFAFTVTTGGYYLRDKDNTVYLTHSAGTYGEYVHTTTDAAAATVWTLKTKAEHDAILAAYPADNKTAIITAANISTTAAEFDSYLAANLAAKDYTSHVGTAKFTSGAGYWTWSGVRGQDKQPAYGANFTEAWNATGTWSQTISSLPQGIYKVTVNGFERRKDNASAYALGEAGYSNVVSTYLSANGEQVQFKSWYDEVVKDGNNYDPNNTAQAATAFNNDKYKNVVYAYVGADGNLTLKICKPNYIGDCWTLWNNVTLTYYDTNVSDEDATAILAEATTTMESPMKHSLYAALKEAKNTFNDERTVPNYNALRTAIDNCETSITSYANMKTNYLDKVNTLLATTNVVDQTSTAYGYKLAYDNYKEDGTADVENATANALTYQVAGSGGTARYTANTANDVLVAGWTINGNDATATSSGFYINTWSTESNGTDDAKDFANPFYEMWVGSGSLAAANLQQTVSGLLPNSTYKITGNVRVQGSSKVASSITMQVSDGVPVDVTAGNQIGTTARYIKSYTATGETDGDGKLTLKFNVAANSNVSWLSFRDLNYAEADVDDVKASLATLIATATAARKSANEGTGVFQIPTAAGTTLASAISAAQTEYDNASATITSINTAISTLNTAIETYENTALNAPESGKRYYIKVATSGHAKENNAINIGYDENTITSGNYRNNPGGYVFKALYAPDSYLAQAVVFTNVSGNNYNIVFERPEGSIYLTYGALNNSQMTWKDYQIQGNANSANAGSFKIAATSTANVFNIYNTLTNSTIACQTGEKAGNIYTEDGNADFTIAEASQASVDVTIASTVKYATRIFPFTPSLPTGVKAYSCKAKGDGDVLTLVEVATPAANTPYILYAENGVSSTDLTGWGTAAATSYTTGWLTGVYTATAAPIGSYVLQNNGGTVGFYNVEDANSQPTIGANRCYLTVPEAEPASGSKAFFFDTEALGINAIDALTAGEAEIYNLNGVRLPSLQKGMNIIKMKNGKTQKVMVK